MPELIEHYIAHSRPLVKEFIQDIENLDHPEIRGLAEPFLPLFGRTYETSALRLVIIGQDTLGWGDLLNFLKSEKNSPGSRLREMIDFFQQRPFTEWGAAPQRFWGFAMMILAALHGRQDWAAMKGGAMKEILDSFAWGNGNAIELYSSSAAGKGAPAEYWGAIRAAGSRFNRFRHIAEAIRPNVALIMYRGIHLPTYLEGYRCELVSNDGRLAHYFLPDANIDVIHVPHPGSMNRIEGTNHFSEKLKELFATRGLTAEFPEFLNGAEEGAKAMSYLREKAPREGGGSDKYECVAWIADELRKRDTFMSVPALCTILNEHGFRTNYGEEFSGGRGSYRLVSGAYHRMKATGQADRAHNIAVAFRRPNFEYAYPED